MITTVAFWKAVNLSPKHVKLDTIKLTKLDQDQAILDISGKLENTFLMNYVQFKLTKPLNAQISIKNGFEAVELPFISFVIPAGELVDPQTRKFSLKNIQIAFHDGGSPMAAFNDLLRPENFIDADLDDILDYLPSIKLNMDFGLSTNAFWIPFWFTSEQELTINLQDVSRLLLKKKSVNVPFPEFKLKEVEFVQKIDSFSLSGSLFIPNDLFPEFVYIEVPALNWELRQKTLEPSKSRNDTSTNYSASHRIMTFKFPKQVLDGSKQNTLFTFNLLINEHDRNGITETLSAFRDFNLNNLIISLAHNSKSLSPCKGICKWLAPLEIHFPIGPLKRALSENSAAVYSLPTTHNPIFDVEFNGVKNNPNNLATFSFTTSFDVSALLPPSFEKFINFKEIFKTPFPEFKTRILLDNGGNGNPECLLTTSINHFIDSEKVFKLEILLVLNNLESLTRSSLNLIGSTSEKQKLFITGSPETFLSSILIDPLAIEIDSLTLKPRFRHGKKLALSQILPEIKSNSNEVKFTETVRHKTTISTKTSSTDFSLKGHMNFAASSASAPSLPFIKLSWTDACFGISPTFKKSAATLELLNLQFLKGGCNVYLSPTVKNPILLLHEGFLDFKIEIKSFSKNQETLLNSWKLFIRNLIVPNAPNFVPFVLTGKSKPNLAAAFKTSALLPTNSFILPLLNRIYLKSTGVKPVELPENWLNWFKSLAETTVKISGMRGLTTQLLIELPQMEICSRPIKFDSYAVDLRIEMSSLDLNICRRNQKSSKPL